MNTLNRLLRRTHSLVPDRNKSCISIVRNNDGNDGTDQPANALCFKVTDATGQEYHLSFAGNVEEGAVKLVAYDGATSRRSLRHTPVMWKLIHAQNKNEDGVSISTVIFLDDYLSSEPAMFYFEKALNEDNLTVVKLNSGEATVMELPEDKDNSKANAPWSRLSAAWSRLSPEDKSSARRKCLRLAGTLR